MSFGILQTNHALINDPLQGLESGMAFPPFSDYQDVFLTPLPPSLFASFIVPTWIPPPAQLLRLAKVVYPYWKERRIERGGHRIVPILNVGSHAFSVLSV